MEKSKFYAQFSQRSRAASWTTIRPLSIKQRVLATRSSTFTYTFLKCEIKTSCPAYNGDNRVLLRELTNRVQFSPNWEASECLCCVTEHVDFVGLSSVLCTLRGRRQQFTRAKSRGIMISESSMMGKSPAADILPYACFKHDLAVALNSMQMIKPFLTNLLALNLLNTSRDYWPIYLIHLRLIQCSNAPIRCPIVATFSRRQNYCIQPRNTNICIIYQTIEFTTRGKIQFARRKLLNACYTLRNET